MKTSKYYQIIKYGREFPLLPELLIIDKDKRKLLKRARLMQRINPQDIYKVVEIPFLGRE